MRLLEDAVKHCEVHLKIRPKPSQLKKPVGVAMTNAPGHSSQPGFGTLTGPRSTNRGFLKASPAPSKMAERYTPAPADGSPGPSAPAFRVPKPMVDPRYGNKTNPELVQEMDEDKEHQRMYPDGCTDLTCRECRNLKRPRWKACNLVVRDRSLVK